MSRQVNRAILLCENWQDKVILLEDTFGKGIEADLAKQKYDFLREGINRISGKLSPDEKMVLALVKKTVNKLEQQLYPHPLVRLLRRMKNLLYDRPLQVARLKTLKAENQLSLSQTLSGLGIQPEKLDLSRQLNFEQSKIDIELISPFGTANYHVKVNLVKDASGKYQMPSYTGTLKDPLDPKKNRSYTFDVALGINAREAANLLQGRAILKHYRISDHQMGSKWMQLDFRNLTPDGQPSLKETSSDFEYNLRQEVIKVAQVLNKPELDSVRVLRGMEEGNQIVLKQVSGETTFLEANPLGKSLTIRDAKGKSTSLETVLEKRKKQQELKPEIKLTKSRRKQKQQDQSMGIA